MQGLELAMACREYAEDKKAEAVVVLDVRGLSSVTDYFVIVTGASPPHVRAVWNEVYDGLQKDHRVKAHKPEGTLQNRWVVIDYFDVIVHVMTGEIREKYDLEGLWNDGAVIEAEAMSAVSDADA
jgi:ribosome-associated protein